MGRTGVALAVLLAFYLAIHFLFLNGKPFFGDEVYFGRVARDIAVFGFPRPELLAHPPAFSYALAASFGLFGFSEWAARLVPTLFGLLSLVVVYKVGESVYSREAGALAVFILVLSKTFLGYTTLVDIDGSAVTFFLLLETYLIFRYLKRPETHSLIPAATLLGVGLLFKLGTVIVPFVVLLFMERKRPFPAISSILLGMGIFLTAYTAYFTRYPWGFWTGFLRPLSHFFGTAGGVREPLLKFLGVLFWNASFPLVLLLGYSLLRALSEDDRKAKFLAFCAILILLAYSLVSHKMERYFVPAIPLIAILAAGYVLPALKGRLPVSGASALLGLAYFSLLGTYSLSPLNVALSLLPLAAAFIFLRSRGAETLLAVVFGLYVGTAVFATAVYASHDYVINECEGQREAAAFIAKNIDEGRVAYTDATVGFYLGGLDYANPVPDLESGIRSGMIKYYAQCKAWPNFSDTPLDAVAGRYENRSFYVKSIKIHEFP